MAFKIAIDVDECIGCGACAAVSDNFELDSDKARAKQTIVDDASQSQEAADACPKGCIKIEEVLTPKDKPKKK